jgi:hypothetical protein
MDASLAVLGGASLACKRDHVVPLGEEEEDALGSARGSSLMGPLALAALCGVGTILAAMAVIWLMLR